MDDAWRVVLVAALGINAIIGVAYRVVRLRRGGPSADVVGQAVLGLLLAGLALAAFSGAGWARWAALVYGLLFGLVVMPVWTLAVLLPLRPRPLDVAYAVVYWLCLAAIVAAAVAL
jgi:hypothetical protein